MRSSSPSLRLALAGLLIPVFAVGAETGPSGVRFPGARDTVVAPSGRYAAVWVHAGQTSQGTQHELLLKDLASERSWPLQAFAHWVAVLWAPSGTRLAVTEGVGSDRSEVWVYRTDELSLPFDVGKALAAQRKGGLDFAAGADHRYFEAVEWLQETELTVRVWGYRGAKPFERTLKVKVPE
jgi:hypothetical protein